MKEDFEAYFRLSAKGIDIGGPVDFVKQQVAANSEIINLFIDKLKIGLVNAPSTDSNISKHLDPIKLLGETNDKYAEFEDILPAEDIFKKHENVIAKNGDKIQVLVTIPGDNLAQRMVNLILIYVYLKLKSKVEIVSFDELRDACEAHGELDRGHFSAYIKSNKKFFVTEGSGKATTAKLTIPGMKEAEKLLNSLNNQN